ncbi:hypothetical protein HYY69_02105 [Candidatus Woesearchaeota archaeon]|nr:hypothetical protein [Candidatus Woesearchaeota archaeon]
MKEKKRLIIVLLLLVFFLLPYVNAKINYVIPQSGTHKNVKSWLTFEDAQKPPPDATGTPVYTLTNDKIKKIPTMVTFVGKEAFSTQLTPLDFEGLSRASEVSHQYYTSHDIAFLPEKNQRLVVLNPDIQDEFYLKYTPHSGKNALAALPKWPYTSKYVPLVMGFKTPKKRVGFYIGNGNEYGTDNVAYIRAYDQDGKQIGVTLFREHFPNAIQTFIGIESRGVGISRLSLDYGRTNLPELIDDIITEDYVPEVVPRSDLYIKSVRYSSNTIVAVVCNGGDIKTSNFLVAFSVYDVTSLSRFEGVLHPTQCIEIPSKSYSQTFQFAHELYPVYAYVDPKDLIIETNEKNNQFIRNKGKELAPVINKSTKTSTTGQSTIPSVPEELPGPQNPSSTDLEIESVIEDSLPSLPVKKELYGYCAEDAECITEKCVKNKCVQQGALFKLLKRLQFLFK